MPDEQKEKISSSLKKTLASDKMNGQRSKAGKENANAIATLRRLAKERIQIDKTVVLTNTKEEFSNHIEAGNIYGIQNNKILKNCLGETLTAGKNKEGNHLIWVFKESFREGFDYQTELEKEYETRSPQNAKRKVICLPTGEVFDSIKQASERYNLQQANLSKVCQGKRKHAGKLKDGTKLSWKYA